MRTFNITTKTRLVDGKEYLDVVCVFKDVNKEFVLVPLSRKDNKKMVAYFYALLRGEAKR